MSKHHTLGLRKGRQEPLSKDQEMICGAMCKSRRFRYDLTRRQRVCQNPPIPGRTRCRFHGGASTGATTPEGRAKSVAAMVTGRRAWLERLQNEGKKIPCGRRAGEAWVTRGMKAKQEAERYGVTPNP